MELGAYALDLVALKLVAAQRFVVAVAAFVCGVLSLCKIVETVCCGDEFSHDVMEYGVSVFAMSRWLRSALEAVDED